MLHKQILAKHISIGSCFPEVHVLGCLITSTELADGVIADAILILACPPI